MLLNSFSKNKNWIKRTKRLVLVSSVFFLITNSVFGKYTLSGEVRDRADGLLISFANIQILSIDNQEIFSYTTTDSNGKYSLEVKKIGTYLVKISHINYVISKKTVKIKQLHEKIHFELEKKHEVLDEVILNFEPEVMKIRNDTINYNLKALTTGEEKTLANILDKLPGVKLNSSGLITVNGKLVEKLLVDGEELFKNQHRATTESVTAKMIEGIRYLDKYQDFGNIEGFDNKQTNALDVSIKDEYKNKVTGDFAIQLGHETKSLGKANLYRFGGRLKFGLIANANNLGKQSITSFEYDQLRGIGFDETDKNGFKIDQPTDDSPKFLDPTSDVAERTNLFGALSVIYKSSNNTKVSFLNLASNSKQKQFLINNRQFFEPTTSDQIEQRAVQSNFFLNSSIFEFGYQPTEKSFLEYSVNFNPQNTTENFAINNTTISQTSNVSQIQENRQYSLDQRLSYLTRIGEKTLLKTTGVMVLEDTARELKIAASTPVFLLQDELSLAQNQITNRTLYGYQLQAVSKFKKEKLHLAHGTIFSNSQFKNVVGVSTQFNNFFISDRIDSYVTLSYDGRVSKRLKYRGVLGYKFISLRRFNQTSTNNIWQPSVKLDYKISNSKSVDFRYSYDTTLPIDEQLNSAKIVRDYFSLRLPSRLVSDQLLPRHSFNLFYSSYKNTTGNTFSTFVNYNYAPVFLTFENSIEENATITSANIIGSNQKELSLGLRFNKRFKSKLGVFSNFNSFYSEEENSISGIPNKSTTSIFKNKGGIYSRFRKGVNFNLGLDLEIIEYTSSLLEITNKAIATKPYLVFNGNLLEKKVLWSIGGEYANYKTDLDETNVINIYPKVTYEINDNFEISIEGNNILNIDNAEITRNFNTINYSESSVVDTLEGYIVFGLYYRL